MKKKTKGKIIALGGTIAFHSIIIALLFLIILDMPKVEEESGVPVMMGNVEKAAPSRKVVLTKVDILDETPVTPKNITPAPTPKSEPLITQNVEKSLEVKENNKKEETKKSKQPSPKVNKERPKEISSQEKEQLLAEQKRIAKEKAKEENKKKINAQIARAFGKSKALGEGSDEKGKGLEGSKEGTEKTGKSTGTGGYGSFDLGGRSLGEGGLPRPTYNVQDEGRVVVAIIVNPEGKVVSANISPRGTTTTNSSLRRSALKAAQMARFNKVNRLDNQSGTITYFFELR